MVRRKRNLGNIERKKKMGRIGVAIFAVLLCYAASQTSFFTFKEAMIGPIRNAQPAHNSRLSTSTVVMPYIRPTWTG
jgi:hypothetical protein